MLTLFSTPKPFQGHVGIIQRNAIASWTMLRPRPEIILFGDEPGTSEICNELRLTHVPDVACTESGVPLLGDLFEKAGRLVSSELLCYVNADIILLSEFVDTAQRARVASSRFLMVGRNWRIWIREPWDFVSAGWEERLRAYVRANAVQSPPPGNSDFFLFTRGLWSSIPPLAIGRGWWDPWLVYEARRLGADVVDASTACMAIHQNHDQGTVKRDLRRWSREIGRNRAVAGAAATTFCLYDATLLLTPKGVARPSGIRYWSRRLDTMPLFHPGAAIPLWLPRMAIAASREFRRVLLHYRHPLLHLGSRIKEVIPDDGIISILGLRHSEDSAEIEASFGMRLAQALLTGGSPVVAYDPDATVMERAQSHLAGPIEFASSAQDCVARGDVAIIASPAEEFRDLVEHAPVTNASPRVFFDCCGFLDGWSSEGAVKVISWNRR